MPIKVTLRNFERDKHVDAQLADRCIVVNENFNFIKTDARNRFDYEFAKDVEIKSNGQLNTILKYAEGSQVFTHLNCWQKQQLTWMFERSHFQKHWKSYVGWFVVPLVLFFASKWTGVFDMIVQAILDRK